MATVYYWKFSKNNVGHLSLGLSNKVYISHWPEGSAKPFSSPMRGSPVPSLQKDIEQEGQEPDEKVTLPPGMIDIEKIKLWWNSQIKSGTSYQLFFSNCAQMVRSALLEGGLARHEPPSWDGPHQNLTPYEILTWVKACKNYYDTPKNPLHEYVTNLFRK